MLPLCMPAGLGPFKVGLDPSPAPTAARGLFVMCAVPIEGELVWDGGEAPVILSDRLRVFMRGEA